MPSHGELPIGLLEVVVAGAAVDAEDLVVIGPHLPRRRRLWRLLAPAGGARGRRRGVGGPTLGSSGLSNLDRLWMPRRNHGQASQGGGWLATVGRTRERERERRLPEANSGRIAKGRFQKLESLHGQDS